MNLRLVVITLLVLLVPPLIGVVALSSISMIQPTIGGYDILTLMKINVYYVNTIIYIVVIILLIFKYKVVFDSKTALTILVFGLAVLPLIFVSLKFFLVPGLSQVSPLGLGTTGFGEAMGMEYNELFRGQIMISVCYLSFIFSIFLSQLSNKPLFKILIFVFGGLFLSSIFSYLEIFTYNWLA